MSPVTLVLSCVAASALGALLTALVLRARAGVMAVRLEERDREVQSVRTELAATSGHLTAVRAELMNVARERDRLATQLDAERAAAADKLALLDTAKAQLRDTFVAASQDALQRNNQVFLDLASTKLDELHRGATSELDARQQAIDLLVKPVHEKLQLVDDRLAAFDTARAASHSALQETMRQIAESHGKLAGETETLVRALRTPHVRGQWGEMQLRRVVELAGMLEHCDFLPQVKVQTDDGRLRPDLVVHLPGDKLVVVDAKAPLAAYLDAIDATDDATQGAHLARHAKQVRDHVVALSAKDYANEFAESPDFVVMFLPGEAFFSAACQRDPSLIEFAIQRSVIPASPTTLITVLKAVNYGWQQERVARNAAEIRDLGTTLYERLRIAAGHFADMRKGLERAVGGYNSAIGALESRVLPSARRFRDLGAGTGSEIATLEPVDSVPRLPAAAELAEIAARIEQATLAEPSLERLPDRPLA